MAPAVEPVLPHAATLQPDERHALIASAPALTLALESLCIDATARPSTCPQALVDLAALERRFDAAFGGIGAVAEAFALAWEAAGDAAAAQRWFERAWRAEDGTATLRVARRLGQLGSAGAR